MRLFTGLALPAETEKQIADLLETLRPTAPLAWTRVGNLHVTTRFIGEWPEEQLEELKERLTTLQERSPLSISISGIGWFPNPHSPRVLFAGVRASEDLQRLVSDTNAVLQTLGLAPEEKAFRPHLTLARINKSSVSLAALRQSIASRDSPDFGDFLVSGFSLFQSKPGPGGSIYTRLADFRFLQ
ncbi:MAG: RNA 2',3'-cyclic phosphodiesterase [Bryobacteraceae bacterium]|nr:RNA 2',3'-cyclic phosphodiesterase [Bryobacteraceae bacterium]